MTDPKKSTAPKKLTDQQILDAWVNNPNIGVTKIARILGVRYESLTYRLDKLIGPEERKARAKQLTGRGINGNSHKPNDSQREWGQRGITGAKRVKDHKITPKRWFGETEEQFQQRVASLQAQATGEDYHRIQQQLRAQSRIAQRVLGDPDAPHH